MCYPQDQTQKAGDVVLHAFDPVTIRLSLNSDNIQHEKFVMQLVKPFIEGFSVAPLNESETTTPNNEAKKRKTDEEGKKKNKRRSKN